MEPVSEAVVRRPAPELATHVRAYVGYREEGLAPGLHRGLPSGSLTFVLPLVDRLVLADSPGLAGSGRDYDALVSGLHTGPALIAHPGRQVGIQLDVTPLGCRALFGLPAGALAATCVRLEDLLGAEARRLVDGLREATTWAERFALLDRVLAARVRSGPAPVEGEVAWAWARLAAADGAVRVTDLAAEVGWSRRHLGERFRTELGLTPKAAARVLRFDRVRRHLAAAEAPSLAAAAAECGYADQAHLTRDFRDLAGCPPSRWLAEEGHRSGIFLDDAPGPAARSA